MLALAGAGVGGAVAASGSGSPAPERQAFLGSGLGHHGVHRAGRAFGEAVAAYIGITRAQLRQEILGGNSLAQVATEHGKSVDGLKQAILDAAKKRLDAAVSAGRLSSANEQRLLDRLQSRIDAIVNHAGPPSGLHR